MKREKFEKFFEFSRNLKLYSTQNKGMRKWPTKNRSEERVDRAFNSDIRLEAGYTPEQLGKLIDEDIKILVGWKKGGSP